MRRYMKYSIPYLSAVVLVMGVTINPVLGQPSGKLEFIPNGGQWDKKVQYGADLGSGKVYLEKTGFYYVMYDAEAIASHHKHLHEESEKGVHENEIIDAHSVRVNFTGASAYPVISGQAPLLHYLNFYYSQGRQGTSLKPVGRV